MDQRSRFVNWLPHHHDMGLMGGILYPLLAGGYSVQMNPLEVVRRPATWLQAITDYRATFSGGPAFAFADCLARIEADEAASLDLSSWERAFCGAEPIPAGLLPAFRRRFSAHGLRPESVYACYGMAENTLFVAGEPERCDSSASASTFEHTTQPCQLNDETRDMLRIVDPERGSCVLPGESGEIWVSGESRGYGYLGLRDETSANFEARLTEDRARSWLRTGDLGIIKDKQLWIVGRIKDILIVNGRKLAAAELEWLAADAHEALNPLAAAAFQLDASGSSEAVLLIELRSGHARPECIETVCRSIGLRALGEWGVRLVDIRVLERGSLQRTTSGKIRRQAIAAAYRQGSAPAGLEPKAAATAT